MRLQRILCVLGRWILVGAGRLRGRPNRQQKHFVPILASFALALLGSPAAGSPFISIGEGQTQSWADAPASGNIQTAIGLTDQELNFYTGEVGAGNFGLAAIIELEAVNPVVINAEGHDPLVKSWDPWAGSNEPNDLSIAAWEYVYDVDPDLTGFTAHF